MNKGWIISGRPHDMSHVFVVLFYFFQIRFGCAHCDMQARGTPTGDMDSAQRVLSDRVDRTARVGANRTASIKAQPWQGRPLHTS